jgi:transcriptional regulator with XRE-family HTH domain
MRTVTPKPFPSDLELRTSKQLGVAVRSARTQAGLTLADAAMTLGVAKQTLSDLELGKPSVGLGLALEIAAGLGVALFMVPASAKEQTRMRLMNVVGINK